MSTRHSLRKTAFAYWRDYAVAGVSTFIVFAALSIPAAVAVWTAYPAAIDLFVLAVVSLVLHTGAAFVREVQTGAYEPNDDADIAFDHTAIVLGVLFLYVTPLVVAGAVGGQSVGQVTGTPLVGLAIALYYPVVDFELVRRGLPSPGVLPLLGLFGLLHAIGLCRDVSPQQVIRRFRRRPPMPQTY